MTLATSRRKTQVEAPMSRGGERHGARSTQQPRVHRRKPGVLVFLTVAGSAFSWRSMDPRCAGCLAECLQRASRQHDTHSTVRMSCRVTISEASTLLDVVMAIEGHLPTDIGSEGRHARYHAHDRERGVPLPHFDADQGNHPKHEVHIVTSRAWLSLANKDPLEEQCRVLLRRDSDAGCTALRCTEDRLVTQTRCASDETSDGR